MTGVLPELSAMDRLRWIVCRKFRVLPGSVPLSDADYLRCGINMLIDRQMGKNQEENPDFDQSRFEALMGGEL